MTAREIFEGIRKKDRLALSKGVTLVESLRDEDRLQALELIGLCHREGMQSRRIAISGSPGVGKSTFIESFGLSLVGKGESVAVLAIDPTSSISKGSILGDKTRMEELSRSELAFIRPSPNREEAGGLGISSYEISILCEAAGYDYILIETVGVGQSEIAARYLCDLFILILQPGAGDELQSIKRGIVEIADLFVVNKYDGSFREQAEKTRLRFLAEATRDEVSTREVILYSSIKHYGLEAVATFIEGFYEGKNLRDLTKRRDAYWLSKKLEKGIVELCLKRYRQEIDRIVSLIEEGVDDPFPLVRDFLTDLDTASNR